MDLFKKKFAETIIYWFEKHKRKLPWRETNDPYKIWLSEVILQQTRVNQGLPYYLRFINNYPTVFDLANAEEKDVLKLWQGLGYYSRARNLLECAKTIVKDYNGRFPVKSIELQQLKGVGEYTAAAIASIAFSEKVPVIDGNVYRVLSRIFGLTHDIAYSKSKKYFRQISHDLMESIEDPGNYNQAVMEFGATKCVPKNPNCTNCIFNTNCIAYEENLHAVLPVKSKNSIKKGRYFNYFIFESQEAVIIKKREAGDIWNGLYDFILLESDQALPESSLIDYIKKNLFIKCDENIKLLSISEMYKHVLTHQYIFARFIRVWCKSMQINDSNSLKIEKDKLINYPMPKLIVNYLDNEKIYIN
ncbi:MAG TPA: A/G-specific adenine glycosylase [Cyclobacteriaceae bacterium]